LPIGAPAIAGTLATDEFIRRFLIHVLPKGFHRIRHYGLFATPSCTDNIARARELRLLANRSCGQPRASHAPFATRLHPRHVVPKPAQASVRERQGSTTIRRILLRSEQ
jgi:hypothetical protein